MQRQFEVGGPVELDVRLASGEIEVDATLPERVEVELTAHDDESRALLENARIELQDHGSTPKVLVDVPQKRGGFSFGLIFGRQGITCRIRCPERSALAVRSKSADVTARGTLGGTNVASASGDVEVERVDGSLNVKTASGDVIAREITAGVNVQTASGDVEVGVARGPVNVATASGDVEVGEAYDSVSANTVSGDQRHGAVMQGAVGAHSVSGDIEIGVRRGSKVWLDCNTVSGDTSSELEVKADVPDGDGPLVEIRAKTVSGDIRITRAPAPAGTMEVHA
jgi:Putative adhesin